MSLRLQPIGSIPEHTALVAHAAFPKGHPYLTLRDHLGTIFQDEDFATLLVLVTWVLLGPVGMALSGCMMMDGCDALCSVPSGTLVIASAP